MRHLVLLLALTLVACQPHVAPSPGSGPVAASASAGIRELMKTPFVCGEAACPDGVGVMTALTELGWVTCTGFLVGERTFVTNRQCLPDALKRRGATCRGKVAVRFLAHAAAAVDCKTVLDVSDEERSTKPDFAYLELDESRAGALPLSREGVGDDQPLTVWAVTHVAGRNVLAHAECRSVLNSLLNPLSASAFSATSVAVGCEVRPGNFGAPLMNARGEVLGLVQSRALADLSTTVATMFKDRRLSVPERPPTSLNFANLACVTNPTNGAGPHPNCARVVGATAESCGVDELATDDARERAIDQIVQTLPTIFRYKVAYDENRRAAVAEPICAVTQFQDVNAWLRHVQISKWLQFRSLDVTYDGLTRLEGVVTTDANLKVNPALTFKTGETWPQRYRLDFYASAHYWAGTISRERAKGQAQSLDVRIDPCTAGQAEAGNQRVYRASDGRELTPAEWRQRLEVLQVARCPK